LNPVEVTNNTKAFKRLKAFLFLSFTEYFKIKMF